MLTAAFVLTSPAAASLPVARDSSTFDMLAAMQQLQAQLTMSFASLSKPQPRTIPELLDSVWHQIACDSGSDVQRSIAGVDMRVMEMLGEGTVSRELGRSCLWEEQGGRQRCKSMALCLESMHHSARLVAPMLKPTLLQPHICSVARCTRASGVAPWWPSSPWCCPAMQVSGANAWLSWRRPSSQRSHTQTSCR